MDFFRHSIRQRGEYSLFPNGIHGVEAHGHGGISLHGRHRAGRGIFPASQWSMHGLHSATKGEREVIRQLVHTVLVRDMTSFNPDRFREWIKAIDTNFRKVALTLTFKIHDRSVHFTIKQLRGGSGGGRVIFQFASATRVRFDDSDVAGIAPIIGNG